MRKSACPLIVLILAGCQPQGAPVSPPDLVEPAVFSTWPSVTEKPVQVGLEMWGFCRSETLEEVKSREERAKVHGPHAGYSIVVRVSPEAKAGFGEGKPMAPGTVVVKEKYKDASAEGPLHEYALMIKREAGYYPEGGDWEYAYVDQLPERRVSRGRLTQCSRCHALTKEKDYLFRSYGGAGR